MPARDEDAKGQWRHTQVILAPMWFPSSKTCSACGTVNAKLKRERRWTCPNCGTRHDRNLNAAINLRNLIMRPEGRGGPFPSSVTCNVCGTVNRGKPAWICPRWGLRDPA